MTETFSDVKDGRTRAALQGLKAELDALSATVESAKDNGGGGKPKPASKAPKKEG